MAMVLNKTSKMATDYYKSAADCSHSEATFNHGRCLRSLKRWEVPYRSCEVISYPPSFARLSQIFHDLVENLDPLDGDVRQLVNFFGRSKTRTPIPVISTSSSVKWLPDAIRQGDLSVERRSLDSKSVLKALKTSFNPDCVEKMRCEAAVVKTLKPPLVVDLHRDISNIPDHNSGIVSGFSWTGSLASHLKPAECYLSGPN
jgi:TPR repeat protein